MFSTAKAIGKTPTAKAKQTKPEHQLTGIRSAAILDAVIKAATAMKATIESNVKQAGFHIYSSERATTRPSSFVGVDGDATASVEFRKRSTASALTEEEIAILANHKITPFEQVVTQELFAVNPAYADDQAVLAKVEAALKKLGLPDDFIVKQVGVTKMVVTDEMLDLAYRDEAAENALRLMVVPALKTKLSAEYNMENLFTDALEIMQPKKAKVTALPMKKKA